VLWCRWVWGGVLDDAAAFVDLFPSGVDSDGLCANWGEMGDLSSV